MDISELVNNSDVQYIRGQQHESICTIASFYIGKYLIENKGIVPNNILTSENLQVLENKKREIEVDNGIELSNRKLLEFYSENNYIYMSLNDNLNSLFLESPAIEDESEKKSSFIINDFVSEFENSLFQYISHINSIYSEYITQIIHANYSTVIAKYSNNYYLINSHQEYKNPNDALNNAAFVIKFTDIKILAQFYINIRQDTVKIHTDIPKKDQHILKQIDISTFVYASKEFQIYRKDMEDYITKNYFKQGVPDKLQTDNITPIISYHRITHSFIDLFPIQFKNWYVYENSGGGNCDCLIISFLTATLPIYYKLQTQQRYAVASYFRRTCLMNTPYRELLKAVEPFKTQLMIYNDVSNDINTTNFLYEDVSTRLSEYFKINILYISLNKISDNRAIKGQTPAYQCSFHCNKNNSPFYVICNFGNAHFEVISSYGNNVFEISYNIINTLKNPFNENILKVENYLNCEHKEGDIVIYKNKIYMVSYREHIFIGDNILCDKYELVGYNKIRTMEYYYKITKGYSRKNLDNLHTLLTQYDLIIVNRDDIEYIKKYEPKKLPLELLEQMETLQTSIQNSQLRSYQKYLIDQHKTFFNLQT